ncbi:hypothetical protein [Sphingobacterium anhuiense]|uniref:hypothetical protein n=1 Tax=Sphingobacterium anhuiense TaxID=493780 RepID=UPI003C2D6C6B
MEYVKLTHAVLKELKKDGYNILLTKSTVEDEDPEFTPEYKSDLWGFLETLDGEEGSAVIDDLLALKEEDLKGTVLY